MNRRKFLYTLGASAPIVVATFIGLKGIRLFEKENSSEGVKPSEFPILSDNIKTVLEEDGFALIGNNRKCVTNDSGKKVIEFMDGKRNIHEIATLISEHFSIEKTPELESSIALFICDLGKAGYLNNPYYITFYESYT